MSLEELNMKYQYFEIGMSGNILCYKFTKPLIKKWKLFSRIDDRMLTVGASGK